MSSRIFRQGQAAAIEPMEWRRAGAAAVEDPEAPPPESPEETAPDPRAEIEALGARFESRIAEMQRQFAAELESARRQAHQQGWRDGEAEVSQRAAAQMDAERERTAAEMARSVAEMVEFRVRIRRQLEQDLVRLAIVIARRILHRELQVDPDALLGIVKAAVAKVDARELLGIHVAASDLERVRRHVTGLGLPARVDLSGDASLPPGSVRLATQRGELDASVDTQLDEIDRGLSDLVRRSA